MSLLIIVSSETRQTSILYAIHISRSKMFTVSGYRDVIYLSLVYVHGLS